MDCIKWALCVVNNVEQSLCKSSTNFKIESFSLCLFNGYEILKIGCLIMHA